MPSLFNPNQRGNPYTPRLVNNANAYGQIGQQQESLYNQYAPQQQQAIQQYANVLNTDPNTDAFRTDQIARATSGTTDNYLRAQAAISARSARSGTVGGSMGTGGANSLDIGRAGLISSAGNQFANEAYQQRLRNLQQLPGLYGNAANSAMSGQLGALGAQSGLLGNLQGNFQREEELRAQQKAQEQAALMQFLGFAGQIGGAL